MDEFFAEEGRNWDCARGAHQNDLSPPFTVDG